MEQVFEQESIIGENHVDTEGIATPSALLSFALDAAGKHCVHLNADWDTLASQGMFWAVLRHRLQIIRYPVKGEVLRVQTWPMPTTRSAYPRAAVAYDAKGEKVFQLVSLWVLMDISARAMILPGKSGISVPGILRGNEPEPPASISPCDPTVTAMRTVCQGDLDKNNHMTNTRYLDWVDSMGKATLGDMRRPKEIRICYLAEALLGQELCLGLQTLEDGVLQVEGRRLHTDVSGKTTRIFAARLYF